MSQMESDELNNVDSCEDSDGSEEYDSDSMEKELTFDMATFNGSTSKEEKIDTSRKKKCPDVGYEIENTSITALEVVEPVPPDVAYVICRSIPCVVPFMKQENEHSNMGRVRDNGKMLFEVGKDSDISNLVNGPESNWPSAKTFDPMAIVVIKGRTAIDTPLYTPLTEGPFVW